MTLYKYCWTSSNKKKKKKTAKSLRRELQLTNTCMMMLSKVLACFLLLAGLNSFTAFGIYMSPTCLRTICLSGTSRCAPNRGGHPKSTVSSQDVDSINSLLALLRHDDSFDCSDSDVVKYQQIIECSCNNGSYRITEIDFSDMRLRGQLSTDIGNLTYLQYLFFPFFFVSIWLYPTFYRDLSGNKISGSIPTSLTNLKQLNFLDLCYNNLEGHIPRFNGENKELQYLYLCSNQLNGSIPKELGELPNLQYLYLRYNALSGSIPNEIWNIKSLVELQMQDNQLEGPLPEQLGNLKNLGVLFLMNNNFFGELPKRIGELTNLQYLIIRGNNFNGTIPDAMSQLQNLQTLGLVGNNFKGPLPKAFSSKKLIYLAMTDIFGDENGLPFPDVRGLTNLQTLTLRNCSLIGPIPPQVWQLPNLTSLDLSFNKLSGMIPLMLKDNFTTIYLRRNNLTGPLPAWVNSTNASVDVSENLFTNPTLLNGTISNNTNLFACCSSTNDTKRKWLDVSYHCDNKKSLNNQLYINCGGDATTINGSHYEADLDPEGRSTFVLSSSSTWAYSSMGAYASNSKYILNQTCNISMVDAPLYTGARVAPISLKYYGFCLRNDNYTVRLHFAEIGWDPTKDNDIGARRVFNVEIQGKKELHDFNIKEAAGGMYKNITMEFTAPVTNNRLEIHLYWSGKGSTFVPNQYGPLISAISVSAVPKKHLKLSSVSVGAIAGSSVIFVALILALCWMLGWLGGKKPNKDGGVELYPGGVYNFQEIKVATNNFNVNRKIGETGSVYQGVLVDGTEVAVKQLSVKSKQEAHQIINEIGIIYALQHPNVAKPMGCCIKEREVLLVYKYMESISLQNALFGSTEVRSRLNWQTRFKICLGIAKGLAFLHEESKLDIIHSNIKPTNILLDKDFNVKISDFRYSELHDGQLNKQETIFHNMPRAKDTGHMAPEYMQGLPLTPKADVYSFGLVTLEVISGQPHIIVKPKEDIQLLNTAYKCYEEGNLEGLIDESLNHHKDYKHNEAVTILHLAMRCVSPSFDLRPTMSEVVQILEGKKKIKDKRINPSPMVEPIVSPSHSTGSGQVGASSSNVSNSQIIKMEDSIISAD